MSMIARKLEGLSVEYQCCRGEAADAAIVGKARYLIRYEIPKWRNLIRCGYPSAMIGLDPEEGLWHASRKTSRRAASTRPSQLPRFRKLAPAWRAIVFHFAPLSFARSLMSSAPLLQDDAAARGA